MYFAARTCAARHRAATVRAPPFMPAVSDDRMTGRPPRVRWTFGVFPADTSSTSMLLSIVSRRTRRTGVVALLLASAVAAGSAAERHVRTPDEFRAAVAAAAPGTRILLAAGHYGGGYQFPNLRGEPGKPIVIAAADLRNPPVFADARVGLHLSNPAHLELHHLAFTRLSGNGINVDDGGLGRGDAGAHHIVLRGLRVSDVGDKGNQDCIKLSGLWDFRVVDCTIERWGTGGGSGIDLVGCHRGVIEGNTIRHTSPAPPNCTGVQCKGGSSDIAIRGNRFEEAGGRAVNIGGSTGLQFFRPALSPEGEYAEARDIRVEGNTFVGGIAPVAFAGADGGVVRFNTIENPGRWAVRIVQENRAPGFVASRNGEFTDNVIVFTSSRWASGGVNIGGGTAPETFVFARNWWYCADQPARSEPTLPTKEKDGVYGRDPAQAAGKAGASAWQRR
jgi:hypothetical protein